MEGIILPISVGLLVSSTIIGIIYCMVKAFNYSCYSSIYQSRFDGYRRKKNIVEKIGYLLWTIAIMVVIAAICYIIGSFILLSFNN